MAYILVVAEFSETREVYRRHLEDAAHRVATVPDGIKALALALEVMPDMILLDIDEPGFDEVSTLSVIKTHPAYEKIRHVPIVLLTSQALPGQVHEGLDAGCDAYIIKPLDPREIAEELAMLLICGEL